MPVLPAGERASGGGGADADPAAGGGREHLLLARQVGREAGEDVDMGTEGGGQI